MHPSLSSRDASAWARNACAAPQMRRYHAGAACLPGGASRDLPDVSGRARARLRCSTQAEGGLKSNQAADQRHVAGRRRQTAQAWTVHVGAGHGTAFRVQRVSSTLGTSQGVPSAQPGAAALGHQQSGESRRCHVPRSSLPASSSSLSASALGGSTVRSGASLNWYRISRCRPAFQLHAMGGGGRRAGTGQGGPSGWPAQCSASAPGTTAGVPRWQAANGSTAGTSPLTGAGSQMGDAGSRASCSPPARPGCGETRGGLCTRSRWRPTASARARATAAGFHRRQKAPGSALQAVAPRAAAAPNSRWLFCNCCN